jgi:hypothetical protein
VNARAPFTPEDLDELGAFFALADRVVPMRDVAKGDTGERVIGLRHDVDDNAGSLATALRLGEWEFERGISSTFYLLHGAHYWGLEMIDVALELDSLGHEIGLHVNGIAEALREKRDPAVIVAEALSYLREAVPVRGSAAHGDGLCRDRFGEVVFVNDEIFSECPRSSIGPATRTLRYRNFSLRLAPLPRATFGLEYDAAWLGRGDYLSDSGGVWSQPFEEVVARWPTLGQLHVLQHPDWWSAAFPIEVAA